VPSAPSRFEVEHLHRLMIQASVEAAQLDQRLDEARNADSLWPVLRHWSEAAEALDDAVERAGPALQREGTPKDQIDRIRERLDHLEQRSRQFDLDFDLDECVETWRSLGHDLAQLSGRHRDALVLLLRHHQPAIDQATAMLSEAQRHEGLLREQHRKVVALQADRDRARARYERLRQSYLGAQREWEAAQREKGAPIPAQQHEVKKPPLPDLRVLPKERPLPLIVRLPVPKEGAPKPLPAVPRPAAVAKPSPPRLVATRKPEEKKPALPRKPRGAARISLERIERVGGYPTSQDGIGRGAQTAGIWFRADHLQDALLIQGTSAIELGCGTHLDVMPSVQIFSAVPGQPVRGKVSLLLIASGGHLGGVTPRSAQTGAMLAAAAGAGAVVARLGALGKALQASIRETIEDAAAKVFARAQPKAPPHLRPRRHAAAAEHHLARFDHILGPLLFEARAIRGAWQEKLQLHRLLERDHQQRNVVAARLERTLSHLATASHRTLTDPGAGQLRAHLAQMDSVLARLHGKGREELLEGAHAVSSILQRMHAIAARAGGASHIAGFRELIEERKVELQRIARAQLAAELSRSGATGLNALAQKPQAGRGASGMAGLGGGLQAVRAGHPGGFGGGHGVGLGALAGTQGALGKALGKQLEHRLRPGRPEETARILGEGSPRTGLRELAARAELKRKQLAARAVTRRPFPVSSTALLERLREQPKGGAFAAHLAPGGPLRSLCEVAQRGHGLPIAQAAQHYLASRGSSHVWNAVATFNTLIGEGHRPRFSLGSWLKKNVSDHVSHALQAVSQTVTQASSLVVAAPRGISSFANGAFEIGRTTSRLGGLVRGAARGIGGAMVSAGRGALRAAENVGRVTVGEVRQSGHALAQVVSGGVHAARGAASWVHRKAGAAADWTRHQEQGAAHWLGEKVHSGLEWAKKTGVVGAVGTGLRRGLSFVRSAAEHTPLGYAVRKGYGFVKSGGLTKVWKATRHVAGQAWAGLKGAYQATSRFLQSPAGQLLVTGLSLAASFIPGGIVVKAVIGAGIGAMQAISEGKDWKSVLASAAGGALTGALPFLKIGPLAKLGIGALQGGITALASGGSLKDALKGAAGGALDAFDPGAFHALKKLKGFTAAEKLLHGKGLSKSERQLLQSHKLAAPLRALEKAMSNPRARRTVGALEKATSRGVKGGIWVSGKAAKAQHALDKVVGAGDKLHGALSQVHDLAPSLADVLGDNAAGHFVTQVGDWAGGSDEKLEKALGYGHIASSTLSRYRGDLDKGLGFAGVRDPAKAYEKMTARRKLRAGKEGALEHVAQLKLEDHRRKHPELHLAEATRERRHPRPERSGLEKAIARGRRLAQKGRRVTQGVHDGLGEVHDVVEKGLAGADKVQSGLELAAALARRGAGIAGDDSELGQYLTHVAARAEHIHGYLQTGIGFAHEFSDKVGATHDLMERIPGVRKDREHEIPAHLQGSHRHVKKSPHDVPMEPHEERRVAVRAKPHAAGRTPAAAPHKRDPTKSIQHGLQAIEKYKKKAIRTGRRIDSGLTKVEMALNKGVAVGRRVDSGLEKIAAVADQVGDVLGDDSALGHVAHQIGEGAGKGHEKLHQALHVAQTGERFLHKGHRIFHQGLQAAQGHHAKEIEKQVGNVGHDAGKVWKDGKKSVHDVETTAGDGRRAVHDAQSLREHLGAHDWKGAWRAGKRLFSDGRDLLADGGRIVADTKELWSEGKHVYAEGKHLVHGGWELAKGLFGGHQGGAPAEATPEQTVRNALQWVSAFGKQVSAAVKQIERLMHAGCTKEAGDRVQALRAMSEQTRAEVTRAVQAAAHDPQLAKQAATARKHYQEIRAHLLQFIRGLHGLDLDARGAGEVAAKADRAHADGSRSRSRKHHDPVGDLIDDILGGEDGRIHVDRGAARGDVPVVDFQDVDAAALDTWIGSGEGVKLFSEVFGAFIPAEGATVVHHRRPRGGGHARGPDEQHGSRPKRGGFFAKVFDRLEGFADRIAGWAKKGSTLLGEGMHYAEFGMHRLSQIEGAAGGVQGIAGKTGSFLEAMGLHTLAGYAGRIGGAAGRVDEEARTVHGGLKKADRWMGEGKHVADEVEHGAHSAAGIFDKLGHGRFGALVSLFKSSKDGTDGKLSPEKVRLGSVFDEPRRLDVTTLSKMQSFLGADFSGVRIHTGLGAAEVTRRFNAEALTVKDHIFFAPGRFNPASVEGQKLIAHELTHVLQKGRANLDVRTAEGEALQSEHGYGHGPPMETLNLRRPEPGFRLAPEGEGMGASSGIHTAKRSRSRGHEAGGKDELPDGEEFLEQISGRVYELLMDDLEHSFESR